MDDQPIETSRRWTLYIRRPTGQEEAICYAETDAGKYHLADVAKSARRDRLDLVLRTAQGREVRLEQ